MSLQRESYPRPPGGATCQPETVSVGSDYRSFHGPAEHPPQPHLTTSQAATIHPIEVVPTALPRSIGFIAG